MPWFRRRSRDPLLIRSSERAGLIDRLRHQAPYVLPHNDSEVKRLDFQHFLLRFGLRGNFAAPVRNVSSILDVGCGTGRWAMEVATIFPQANVIGVDLQPVEDLTLGYGL